MQDGHRDPLEHGDAAFRRRSSAVHSEHDFETTDAISRPLLLSTVDRHLPADAAARCRSTSLADAVHRIACQTMNKRSM